MRINQTQQPVKRRHAPAGYERSFRPGHRRDADAASGGSTVQNPEATMAQLIIGVGLFQRQYPCNSGDTRPRDAAVMLSLARFRLGRILLHMLAMLGDRAVRFHAAGIMRELS